MNVSVVICTRNRPDTLGQALESVAECDYPSFDVHVMDQSTDDKSQKVVEELAARFAQKLKINYHHLDKAGLSRAYNLGIAASAGEIIACTDDDVVVPKDWIAQIAKVFAADKDAGILYGQVLIPRSLVEAERNGLVVPSLPIPKYERMIRGGTRYKVFGMGANYALRRSVFERAGPFDEALGGGGPLRSSQDYDLAYRIYRTGYAIVLAPDVQVDHYGSRTPDQWPGTMKAYGIGDGAFYSKHIRCGDLLAFTLFSKVLLVAGARFVKTALLQRKIRHDDYVANLFVGVREAWKFDIDSKSRLYRETATAKMTVTEANAVSGVQRQK
ncbi:MAG: glycosyltransferase family A protein [Pseudomonadota bacterium]